ncbi:DUF1761 domain-containing protein [uncultured Psychroserpens sp.]|uniref:DUF1761 domain-containing protein n=1 Tax=uncultured Psychroserpens sp. TaxID=255436 RepID=UPI00263347C8|nr:DUF1761 domain-containing protein [uncultured Psychroserpens sp.]
MKKKIKIRPISIILSALFLSMFGGIWYGWWFSDVQVEAHRYTPEDYANNSPLWYLGGILISLFISWGLGLMVRLQGLPGFKGGIKASIKAAIGFGIPLVSYPYVFSPLHDFTLYMVGLFQIVIAWIIAGAIIGSMAIDESTPHES